MTDLSICEDRNKLEELSDSELLSLYKEVHNLGDTYNVDQLVQKVLINSLYGAIGNSAFILFNEKIAQSITGNGRYFIKLLANNINTKLNELVKNMGLRPFDCITYGDTDSVYYTIEPFVNEFKKKHPNCGITDVTNFCLDFEKNIVQGIIQSTIDEFAYNLNAYDKSYIGAKNEIYASESIFIKKKKYLARLRSDEGTIYPEDSPKMKVMGLELAKSSTPHFTKKYLEEAIDILLDGTEKDIQEFFKIVKSRFINEDIFNISNTITVNSLNYDLATSKMVPFQSKAAIIYNDYVTKNSLTDRYSIIKGGDKIKVVYLKTPNPVMSTIYNSHGKLVEANCVAFTDSSFIEKFRDYIDFDTQFEKAFLSPLKIMTTALNYDPEEKCESVFDFF